MAEFIELGPTQLAIAALLVVAAGIVSLVLQLGVERRLGIAALRTVIQLGLLGLVLERVFSLRNPLLIVGLLILMTAFAAREAVSRTSRRYRGILWDAWLTMAVSCFAVGGIVTSLVVGVDQPHPVPPHVPESVNSDFPPKSEFWSPNALALGAGSVPAHVFPSQ